MSAKLKVGKTKSYFFTISLPDEGRELIFEVKALSENKAWEKLPMEVKKKYEGRRWFYTGRFVIKEELNNETVV